MKVLMVGESWIKHIIHIKGFDTFTNSEYGDGVSWLRKALNGSGIEMEHLPGHLAGDSFPVNLKDLQEYDVVFLSDIGSNTLLLSEDTFTHGKIRPNRLDLIKQYVEQGGGFSMIGGYMSFQGIDCKGRYKNTPIEEILPVELYEFDDRAEHPEGVYIEITKKEHPILKDITGDWPHFLGYNKLKSKPNSTVIAQHNGNPFIAVGEYGNGRTMAFASDCAPHWGSKEFVEWEHYSTFWVNSVKWLANNS